MRRKEDAIRYGRTKTASDRNKYKEVGLNIRRSVVLTQKKTKRKDDNDWVSRCMMW